MDSPERAVWECAGQAQTQRDHARKGSNAARVLPVGQSGLQRLLQTVTHIVV
jgi:hypothetical protein